jgi:hypothetical protein
MKQKITVTNKSLKTDTFEIINPNHSHYQIESAKKFTLAPGMSKICHFIHLVCANCHKD